MRATSNTAAETTSETSASPQVGAQARSADEWTSVCELSMLEPLWSEVALVEGEQVALVLVPDGTLYAVTNRDPATGSCVMSRGIVGSRGDRHTIASPLHKQVYDLETGECFTNPAFALRTFAVRVDAGIVQVQLDATRQRTESPSFE